MYSSLYDVCTMQILDYTSEDDVDHADLQKALESTEKLCDQINEGVRQKENTEQLEWMQTIIQLSLDERLQLHNQLYGIKETIALGKAVQGTFIYDYSMRASVY